MEIKDIDNSSELNVDSLWIISQREKSGKHCNKYHGNFIPQIPNQLIRRYTKEGDIVLDLFMGSGTTLFECERLNRNYIGFDINEDIIDFVKGKMADSSFYNFCINECDVTNKTAFESCVNKNLQTLNKEQVDFVLAHPPYMDIIHFTDKKEDLSNVANLEEFIIQFCKAMGNALQFLAKNKYFAIVIGDVYKKSEVVPLGFYVLQALKQRFKVRLKGIIVKNIEGNRGKLGVQSIWRYRALKSDYFLFKHEYILVFKKEF